MNCLTTATALALTSCLSVSATPDDSTDDTNPLVLQVNARGKLVVLQDGGARLEAELIELRADGLGFARIGTDGEQLVLAATPAAAPSKRIGVLLEPVPDVLVAHLELDPEATIMVADVSGDEPAARAGLRRYDLITAINGERPATSAGLRSAISSCDAGETITLRIIRGSSSREVEVEVHEVAPAPVAQAAGRVFMEDLLAPASTMGVTADGQLTAVPTAPLVLASGERGRLTLMELPAAADAFTLRYLPPASPVPANPAPAPRAESLLSELEEIHARLKKVERMLEQLR